MGIPPFSPTSCLQLTFLVITAIITLCFLSIEIQCKRSVCETDTCKRISQRIAAGIDARVDPCNDFYEFSCGNWMARNRIPDDRTWWSPWSIARVDLKRNIRSMLEENYDPRKHPVPSVKSAINLYKSCMNQPSREALGLAPMMSILNKIGGWPIVTRNWSPIGYNWESAYIYLRSRLGLNYIISMYVDIDSKDTSRRIIYLDRPGLGLGRSELQHPKESRESVKLVSAYKNYIRNSARLVNFDNVPNSVIVKDINDMLRFESRLAKASSEFVDRRDHFGLYNKITIRQLQQVFPGIRWLNIIRRIFKYAKVPISEDDKIVVQDAAYYSNLANIIKSTNPRTIANYIGWRYVLSYSDYTTKNFTDTYFKYQKIAYGQRKPEKGWETCYAIVDQYFPYTIGRLYIDNYFNTLSKGAVERLIKEVKNAFTEELNSYDWMDSTTRKRSKEKLNEMLSNVAFQSFITNNTELERNYKGIRTTISPAKFFSAIVNLDRWQVIQNMRRLRQKVTRSGSMLSGPATVNAFNYFDLNYIQFPAGILQSPFYTFGGPASVNFGAIGKTIGHEIIHGFDDEGKQYDKYGNLKNWWSSKTEREYNKRTECFINEYESFREPTTGLFVNGVDTQGENLADNGGLRMSFKAYKNFVNKFGPEFDPGLPGEMSRFTPDQLFFMSFASIWCENERKESMRNTIKYGSHSPSRFRVIGTVINSKEFSDAFNCPLGSPMNPRKKCILW